MKQTKQPLKEAVNTLYDDIQLSPEELASIRPTPTSRPPHYSVHKQPIIALAASACLIISVLGTYFYWSCQTHSHKMNAIIADVINNHLSHKKLVYQTTSMAKLGEYFAYLGFMLSDSNHIHSIISGDLIGARACLILSIPSAQLRYQLDNHR